MNQPHPWRLAILTPTFARPESLAALHASLAAQDHAIDWVHIIVDDAPHAPFQPTGAMADDDRVVLHHNIVNAGPLVSRNTALDLAVAHGADVVAFIDDDDRAAPGLFAYVAEMMDQHRATGWFVSRCAFDGDIVPVDDKWPDRDGLFDYFDDVQLTRRFVSDVTHVMTTDRIGRVRFAVTGRYQREWTFLSKIARGGGFWASDRITKLVRYHPEGLTGTLRGPAPDWVTCRDYVAKAATNLLARPASGIAWRRFLSQAAKFPPRIALLTASRSNDALQRYFKAR